MKVTLDDLGVDTHMAVAAHDSQQPVLMGNHVAATCTLVNLYTIGPRPR
ncbi:MAG: hypothetical protein JRJ12_04750 [Deltaproteobacteria bacterium]|nr:hypothetical protein [Deltaproteobacteria bacterium]MBW2072702.1 hypothetical protein [Deltaproteobacteria bacterium]